MAKKIDERKAKRAAGTVVVATAAGAAYAASKKKKKLFVALLVILVIVIVGVLVFGYFQGWFDALFNKNGGNGGNGGGGGGGNGKTVADMSIHFINLGANSGDSIYIKAGDTDILIDGGAIASSAETIKNYVDEYCEDGILEYVIVTHGDSDHVAAFSGTTKIPGILDVYQCGTIIRFARTNKNTGVVTNFLSRCDTQHEKYGTNVFTALDCYNNANGAKREYEIADGITMEILYQTYYENYMREENNYSVCVLFTQGDKHYLFTGDLEKEGEESLVASNNLPQVELFKAGHHGSYTSSNEVLLSVIKPKYVVASCAAGDSYKFPRQEFIDRVAPYTDKVYVTGMKSDGYGAGINGNVVFKCVDGVISVECSISDVLLKDSQWFKDNRTLPSQWSN